MSRVGKKFILVPQGVEVNLGDHRVEVKGPKGTLHTQIHPLVSVSVSDGQDGREIHCLVDEQKELDKNTSAQWGTARALIANMIKGVTEGFVRKLEVNGVGYRVNLSGRQLKLQLGFSHEVVIDLPEGIDALVEGNVITLSGADKQRVGELADRLRSLRKPEPYKGKGIKYQEETVRRKAGKTQKSGE